MKILVTYFSQTGNTRKVADAIFDSLQLTEKEIAEIDAAKDPGAYQLVFVGFPVHSNSVPKKADAFLRSIPAGTKVAIFATHGSLRNGPLARTAFETAHTLPKGKVLGTFGCRGKVVQSVIDALMKSSEHKSWAEEAASASTHPDDADLKDARAWADQMLIKARA
jgi:flavodoxin